LKGWEGNDTYVIDNASDSIEEKHDGGYDTGGIDTIITSLSTIDLRAAKYDNVENLTSTVSAGQSTTLYGDSGNNIIAGGAANDTIDGISGSDTIRGGAGNDTIITHSQSGSIDGGEGVDTLQIANDWYGSTFSLSSASISNIENLLYSGTGSFSLAGNSLNNTVTSGTGSDTLDGGAGNDTLIGGAGNDTYIMTLGTGGSDRFIDSLGTSTIKVDTSALTGVAQVPIPISTPARMPIALVKLY
jgi:serralysin